MQAGTLCATDAVFCIGIALQHGGQFCGCASIGCADADACV
jgi:hypothetical protein